ncbi:MAG: ATP-binding protein [Alphaproteobacteria bacterium]|nr:ATP-binding protein [Alphaproteobacteria bacterium]MBU0804914.1 ATP-binding protein [Alphaproteobacteria bacterium]MBU0870413.1 ATP-binding protein [Alphaproteobacteria bacterium]MBU1401912.1 ATP-binding protein [Alphaproteobacteria bacterium]MBU1591671.1 ATP-binding protein [Alphaproteobacteria bacterium]
MTSAELLIGVQKAFMGFDKRAERASDEILEATFVDTGPLFDLVSSANNQVMYGRRGTGKTHVLKYLRRRLPNADEASVYLDLRQVGSNGSIYGDDNRPLSERSYTLIVDVLQALQDELFILAVEALETAPDAGQITTRVDALSAAISEVKVVGEVETSVEEGSKGARSTGAELALSKEPSVGFKASIEATENSSARRTARGSEKIHLNFGGIGTALSGLVAVLGIKRLWFLIDEWSEIPIDLQPYLADLLRRTVLPIGSITIKIAAIDHRSNFIVHKAKGEYVGLELGADITADLNLDEFLVFDNNQEKSTEFFRSLLFRHYSSSDHYSPVLDTPDKLIQAAFTQASAFDEFVRAVEGVPRDALNLATKVATKAYGQQISVPHVRSAARDWYQQDKHAVIRNNTPLDELLTKVISEVIGERRARAFLFPNNERVPLIDQLFDARILHILKKNVSSHDEPGTRYDVYKIDYGCYVDMINTAKAPTALFSAIDDSSGDEELVEVPKDDYRSIRRAILKPEMIVSGSTGDEPKTAA